MTELCPRCKKYTDVCQCIDKCEIDKCERTAYYLWTPRGRPAAAQRLCRQCGEACAGNFRDELQLVPVPMT